MNENISGANLLFVTFSLYPTIAYHRNEKFSDTNLLLVTFVFNEV